MLEIVPALEFHGQTRAGRRLECSDLDTLGGQTGFDFNFRSRYSWSADVRQAQCQSEIIFIGDRNEHPFAVHCDLVARKVPKLAAFQRHDLVEDEYAAVWCALPGRTRGENGYGREADCACSRCSRGTHLPCP
jgi:hypothetical protein